MSLIRDESVPVFLDGHSEENAKYALSGTWVEGGAHVGVRGMDSILRGRGTQGFRKVATPPHSLPCLHSDYHSGKYPTFPQVICDHADSRARWHGLEPPKS